MQISQNIKLKQSQSLVMTPQLQQAIKLLQLNNLELCDLVNKELEENPFLENQNDEEEYFHNSSKINNDHYENYFNESNLENEQENIVVVEKPYDCLPLKQKSNERLEIHLSEFQLNQ